MRKLTSSTFVTLDGVMQAPGGPEEDREGGFESGGWTVPYWDTSLDETMGEYMGKPFDLLLGRKTYDIFAGYWPTSTEPGAEQLNQAHKYVVSRSMNRADWQNSTVIKGDVVAEIRKLKAGDGPDIQVHGSSNLLQTLLKHNLMDEMQVMIFPVVVGKGKRLFGEGIALAGLALRGCTTSGSGVIIARYEPAGALETGTFG